MILNCVFVIKVKFLQNKYIHAPIFPFYNLQIQLFNFKNSILLLKIDFYNYQKFIMRRGMTKKRKEKQINIIIKEKKSSFSEYNLFFSKTWCITHHKSLLTVIYITISTTINFLILNITILKALKFSTLKISHKFN